MVQCNWLRHFRLFPSSGAITATAISNRPAVVSFLYLHRPFDRAPRLGINCGYRLCTVYLFFLFVFQDVLSATIFYLIIFKTPIFSQFSSFSFCYQSRFLCFLIFMMLHLSGSMVNEATLSDALTIHGRKEALTLIGRPVLCNAIDRT